MVRSSGLSGCPPQLRPSVSRPGPCRLPASHSRCRQCRLQFAPFMNLTSPSEFRAFRPACPPPTHKGGRRRTSSSLEVPSPPAPENRSVHLPRPYLGRYVPPSPFHTTSTVYSAPTPSEVSLRYHSWGFSLQGPSRLAGDRTVSGTASPHDLPRGRSRLHGGKLPCLATAPGLQGLTPATRPCPPVFWFPIHRGPTPSWVSTCWDLASLSAPGPKPARSQGRPAPSPVPN